MSSFRLGKKFQYRNKVSKSFAKFSKAITKTSRCIATLLGSNHSISQSQSFPNTPYSSMTSLCECPCSYHRRKREELQGSEDIPKARGVVCDDKSESESRSESESESEAGVDERTINGVFEQGMDEKGNDWLSLFEVDERAERFIESFRENQKLQIQRSI